MGKGDHLKQEEETSGLESIMRWEEHVAIEFKSIELKKYKKNLY